MTSGSAVRRSPIELLKLRAGFGKFWIVLCFKYIIQTAKNIIKTCINKNPYLTPSDQFLKAHLFRLIRGEVKMTSAGINGEGPGSQALMTMNAIAFARASGLEYVHTPFAEIANADRPMNEWVSAWESLFNFGVGERPANVFDHGVVDFASNLGFSRINDLRSTYDKVGPEFIRKYLSNKLTTTNEILTVFVHIRRDDEVVHGHYMWTEPTTVSRTVALVSSILTSHGINHNIFAFSQGDPGDLADLIRLDVQLFLNADAVLMMQESIKADVLIMAKSTFSYVAALLSDGIKIYEHCDYPPLSSWLVRDSDGGFVVCAFENQLQLLIDRRSDGPARHDLT